MAFQALGSTVNIDISGSSQATKISDGGIGADVIRVFNDGTATAWIAFGTATLTTAATSGMPVATKTTAFIRVPDEAAAWVAAIAASTTGKIYFTPGSEV